MGAFLLLGLGLVQLLQVFGNRHDCTAAIDPPCATFLLTVGHIAVCRHRTPLAFFHQVSPPFWEEDSVSRLAGGNMHLCVTLLLVLKVSYK